MGVSAESGLRFCHWFWRVYITDHLDQNHTTIMSSNNLFANEERISNTTKCLIVLLYIALHVLIKQATLTLTFKGAARTIPNNSLLNCLLIIVGWGPDWEKTQADALSVGQDLVFILLTEMPSSNDHLRGSQNDPAAHIIAGQNMLHKDWRCNVLCISSSVLRKIKFLIYRVGLFGNRWWRVPLSVSGCGAEAHTHSFSEV